MDQQKRLFIAIALSFGLTLIFTNFVWKPEAEAEQARLAALDGGAIALADAGVLAPVAVTPPPVAPPVAIALDGGPAQAVVEAPLRRIEASRETMQLAFTTEGGGFDDAVLKGKREHVQQELTVLEGFKKLVGGKFPPPPQIDLAQPAPATAGQFAVSIAGASPLSAKARYAVKEESPGKLVLTTAQGPWELTRTLTWDPAAKAAVDDAKVEKDPSGYTFRLEVAVTNRAAQPLQGDLVLHSSRAIDPGSETAPSMFGGIGNQATVLCKTEKVQRRAPNDKEPSEELKGKVAFIGIDQQYFLSAAWPLSGPTDGRCALKATTTERLAEIFTPVTVQPNETVVKHFGIFLGPKDVDLLAAVGAPRGVEPSTIGAVVAPGLDQTVDFGWWAFICKVLIFLLRFFHVVGNNWGIAIILLTVMVKVVLLPLTHKAMVSAEAMKKLQPKMEEIKKKHAEDKERQNQETMKLYQEAKVNPLGGCLPLLLQLPIWAALFTTLRTSYELYGEPFFGVWSDLTSKDPTYLLPLLLGITMIVTQRLQPQMMDKSQAFLITWIMPVFFTAIMMNYPAGLSLYIFTNNILSIAQQYALRRYLERTGAAAPKKAGVGKTA